MPSLMVTQSPFIDPASSTSEMPSNGPKGTLTPSNLQGNSSSGTDFNRPSTISVTLHHSGALKYDHQ
jgi:hypothetical protein